MEDQHSQAKAVAMSDAQVAAASFLMSALVVVFALMGIVLAGAAGLVFVTEAVIAFVAIALWRMRR